MVLPRTQAAKPVRLTIVGVDETGVLVGSTPEWGFTMSGQHPSPGSARLGTALTDRGAVAEIDKRCSADVNLKELTWGPRGQFGVHWRADGSFLRI